MFVRDTVLVEQFRHVVCHHFLVVWNRGQGNSFRGFGSGSMEGVGLGGFEGGVSLMSHIIHERNMGRCGDDSTRTPPRMTARGTAFRKLCRSRNIPLP